MTPAERIAAGIAGRRVENATILDLPETFEEVLVDYGWPDAPVTHLDPLPFRLDPLPFRLTDIDGTPRQTVIHRDHLDAQAAMAPRLTGLQAILDDARPTYLNPPPVPGPFTRMLEDAATAAHWDCAIDVSRQVWGDGHPMPRDRVFPRMVLFPRFDAAVAAARRHTRWARTARRRLHAAFDALTGRMDLEFAYGDQGWD